METIRSISLKTNAGADFYLSLGDFLDDFRWLTAELRAAAIEETPEDMEKPEYIPFLASTAHKMSLDSGLTPPAWVFNKRCYLPGNQPFFACNARGRLRLWFMFKSPAEFKHRNLFVDENVLARV
jgi:hypothetical protein